MTRDLTEEFRIFYDACRLCGKSNREQFNIFKDSDIPMKITNCIGIQVSETDKLPQNICAAYCKVLLDVLYTFRVQCLEVDQALRSYSSTFVLGESEESKEEFNAEEIADTCEKESNEVKSELSEQDNDKIKNDFLKQESINENSPTLSHEIELCSKSVEEEVIYSRISNSVASIDEDACKLSRIKWKECPSYKKEESDQQIDTPNTPAKQDHNRSSCVDTGFCHIYVRKRKKLPRKKNKKKDAEQDIIKSKLIRRIYGKVCAKEAIRKNDDTLKEHEYSRKEEIHSTQKTSSETDNGYVLLNNEVGSTDCLLTAVVNKSDNDKVKKNIDEEEDIYISEKGFKVLDDTFLEELDSSPLNPSVSVTDNPNNVREETSDEKISEGQKICVSEISSNVLDETILEDEHFPSSSDLPGNLNTGTLDTGDIPSDVMLSQDQLHWLELGYKRKKKPIPSNSTIRILSKKTGLTEECVLSWFERRLKESSSATDAPKDFSTANEISGEGKNPLVNILDVTILEDDDSPSLNPCVSGSSENLTIGTSKIGDVLSNVALSENQLHWLELGYKRKKKPIPSNSTIRILSKKTCLTEEYVLSWFKKRLKESSSVADAPKNVNTENDMSEEETYSVSKISSNILDVTILEDDDSPSVNPSVSATAAGDNCSTEKEISEEEKNSMSEKPLLDETILDDEDFTFPTPSTSGSSVNQRGETSNIGDMSTDVSLSKEQLHWLEVGYKRKKKPIPSSTTIKTLSKKLNLTVEYIFNWFKRRCDKNIPARAKPNHSLASDIPVEEEISVLSSNVLDETILEDEESPVLSSNVLDETILEDEESPFPNHSSSGSSENHSSETVDIPTDVSLSKEQLQWLELAYKRKKKPIPSSSTIRILSKKLGLTEKYILYWFKRRLKEKSSGVTDNVDDTITERRVFQDKVLPVKTSDETINESTFQNEKAATSNPLAGTVACQNNAAAGGSGKIFGFSETELYWLEFAYDKTKNEMPSQRTLKLLTQRLVLPEDLILNWFQNKISCNSSAVVLTGSSEQEKIEISNIDTMPRESDIALSKEQLQWLELCYKRKKNPLPSNRTIKVLSKKINLSEEYILSWFKKKCSESLPVEATTNGLNDTITEEEFSRAEEYSTRRETENNNELFLERTDNQPANNPGTSTAKNKKTKKVSESATEFGLSKIQLEWLEFTYSTKKSDLPTESTIKLLSERLKLTEAFIVNWFVKKNTKATKSTSAHRKGKISNIKEISDAVILSEEQLRVLELSYKRRMKIMSSEKKMKALCEKLELTEGYILSWFSKRHDEDIQGSNRNKIIKKSVLPSSSPSSCGKINPEVQMQLKKFFKKNQNPSPEEYEKLRERLGLKSKSLYNWFNEERKKCEEKYTCVRCNKQLACYGTLCKHMLLHSEEKNCVCEVCDKKFHTKGSLLQHMMYHSSDKLYECENCGKNFSHRSGIHNHVNHCKQSKN